MERRGADLLKQKGSVMHFWLPVCSLAVIALLLFAILALTLRSHLQKNKKKRAEVIRKTELQKFVVLTSFEEFQKILGKYRSALPLKKDQVFIDELEKEVCSALERALRFLNNIDEWRYFNHEAVLRMVEDYSLGQIIQGTLSLAQTRLAIFQKALAEAPNLIIVARQYLGNYTNELNKYTREGYYLGPDRHFAESWAKIREAEMFMTADPPDPKSAIAKCEEALRPASDFVGRINRWLVAEQNAKKKLLDVMGLKGDMLELFSQATRALELVQQEYSESVWSKHDQDHSWIAQKLKSLEQKQSEAVAKLARDTQDFEGALTLLIDVETSLDALKPRIEKNMDFRKKLKEFRQEPKMEPVIIS